MLHVKQIREITEAGKVEEAHTALDLLLEFGPRNVEALKLRAQLYATEGRFGDEAATWAKIGEIDREDPDFIGYFLRKQMEDREHFYFTDDLPDGGRRFMAYPRGLVNSAAAGLIGCMAFLIVSKLSARYPVLTDTTVIMSLFGVMVMGPWVAIIFAFVRGIKSLTLSPQGVTLATRLRQRRVSWAEIETIALARSVDQEGRASLSLMILPRKPGKQAFEINLNQESTVIRARSYLIREIGRLFKEPEYANRAQLSLQDLKITKY